jgi:hypothetical protein
VEKEPSENKATKTEAPAVVFKYVGNGDYFHGIPARDLTAEDVEQLDDENKKLLKSSTLYKKGGTK